MSERSCEDCKHDKWWIEYGVYCHDCEHPKMAQVDWHLKLESLGRDPAPFCNFFELEKMPHQEHQEGTEFWANVLGNLEKRRMPN